MESVAGWLPHFLQKLEKNKGYQKYCLQLHWEEIVGKEIARHSFPGSVERQVLQVYVNNSVWLHHLFLLKKDILVKVQAAFPREKIVDIRFQASTMRPREENIKKVPANSEKLAGKLELVSVKESQKIQQQKWLAQIEDTELKDKLGKLLQLHFKYSNYKQEKKWQTCTHCGIYIPSGHELCSTCLWQEKQRQLKRILSWLKQAPWSKYKDCQEQLSCNIDEFQQARMILMNRLVEAVRYEYASKTEKITLAMLATGKNPQELTDEMIEKQIQQFGRKKYVFASRGRSGNHSE